MSEQLQRHSLIKQMDAYLDAKDHSDESLAHVNEVLTKFDYMVTLATMRALGELSVPGVVEPGEAMGQLIQLRNADVPSPRDAHRPYVS